jgi:hypothetical protein
MFLALGLAGCEIAGGPGDRPADGPADGSSGPYFERPMFFNRDVSDAPVARDSASLLAALRAAGGWGRGDNLHIDFSFTVLRSDATTPRRAFTPTHEFYAPDCDHREVPLPPGGNVEGEAGYACQGGGDCHLIVFDEGEGALYEMWRADIADAASGPGSFRGGCLAIWEARREYDDDLRGDQCASADAAGLPIAPLLFTADEIAAGELDHAIRFVLPKDRIGRGFVRPATHAVDTIGAANAPPFGFHLRLRRDYPVESLPSAGARVVARALQKYGMYHADHGDFALTAVSDRYTAAKWSGLLGAKDLAALLIEDFEVVDHGTPFPLTQDCER